MKKIAIIGTGGFAGEVLAMLKQDYASLPKDIVEFCFVDENYGQETLFDTPIISEKELTSDMKIIIAVGNPELKQTLAQNFKNQREKAHFSIHSIIGENCNFGLNTLIMQGCILTNNITIESYTHVNIGTTIGHGTQIGSFVTISPGCNISGNVRIGDRVFIGTNACIKQGTQICDDVIIGMGSVVVKDITEPGKYFGNPCKIQK